MDDRLQKALEFVNYRETLQKERENLKLKTLELLTYSINGGTFKIDQTLLALVGNLVNEHEDLVLLDVHNNPIKIDNLEEFYDNIKSLYFEVVNDYYQEYEKIKKKRKTGDVVSW